MRQERHDVDARRCAPASTSRAVRQGLLDVTGRLFGLSHEPVPGAPVWHEDVTAYGSLRGGERIGRIYLDLHPRAGKYNMPPSSPSPTASVAGSSPRACWSATSPAG